MMRRFATPFALLLAAAAASVSAQETTATVKMAGNWAINFTSPQGTANWTVKFEQFSDTLRGQAQTDFGALPVYDGWISGNDLSFWLTITLEGQKYDLGFSGKVNGDAAEGTIAVPAAAGMSPIPFTAKRVVDPGTG